MFQDSPWQLDVRKWLDAKSRRNASPISADELIAFFEQAFRETRCKSRAWFGTHPQTVSLVIGGVYLAAVTYAGEEQDKGFWLLVDQNPPDVEGILYHPTKSTLKSKYPLLWGHGLRLETLPEILDHPALWGSFASASEKILASPISHDRDNQQIKRKKRRLLDIFQTEALCIFPDELNEVDSSKIFREGARKTVTVNAYERDHKARAKCIAHHGSRCSVCRIDFEEAYGPIAAGFVHVHHLRPISEIGAEYIVNPIEDLRPVCPNCHAVLHMRRPPFSIEEGQALLSHHRVETI